MTTPRSGTARAAGWLLIGLALLAVAVWVIVLALVDDKDFEKWVGWANILALLAGAIGAGLVILDRVQRRAEPLAPSPEPPATMTITANWGGVAQGAQGTNSKVINVYGPPPAEEQAHDETPAADQRQWWSRLWSGGRRAVPPRNPEAGPPAG